MKAFVASRLRGAPTRKWLFRGLTTVGIVFALALALVAFHVTFNSTDSMPIGFYSVERGSAKVTRGSIVVVCPPSDVAKLGLRRGYLHRGDCDTGAAYLLKIVVATGGDTVVVGRRGVEVDGRVLPASKSLARDAAGRVMARMARGTYRLRSGQYWLWTPNPRSWDSRYFGPIAKDELVGIATLLLPVRQWPYGVEALQESRVR